MSDVPTDLVPLAEGAALLPSRRRGRRLHVSTLYRWIERGRVRGWKLGGTLFVSRAELLALPRPVPVRLQPEAAARLERARREAATDEVLRRAGVR